LQSTITVEGNCGYVSMSGLNAFLSGSVGDGFNWSGGVGTLV